MSTKTRKAKEPEGNEVDEGPRMVIAVEIGRCWSTYVIQTRDDFLGNRLKLTLTGSWQLDGHRSQRTRTSLLLRDDGTAEEFGYMADCRYTELCRSGDQAEWFYFTDIVPRIFEGEEDCIQCSQDKCLPASEVLAQMVGYMRARALVQLQEAAPATGAGWKVTGTDGKAPGSDDGVHWVFTVPAFVHGQAKGFMKAAAVKAGIAEDHVIVITEPECAIVQYSQLPMGRLKVVGDRGRLGYVAAPGSDVMVVDLRDNAVSVSMVDIDTDASMHVVHTSGSVPVIELMLDSAFLNFLHDIVGKAVADAFERDNVKEFKQLRDDFKAVIQQVKSDEATPTDRYTLQLPHALQRLWKAENGGMSVYDIIFNRPDLRDNGVMYQIYRLSMTGAMLQNYYNKSNGVISFIKTHMKNNKVHGMVLSAMFVPGQVSASNSRMEYFYLEKYFTIDRGIPVVTPDEHINGCIVHGAVLFGHNTNVLSTRMMNTTYGIGFTMPFDEEKHNQEWKYEVDGKRWANYVFRKHVSRGQYVPINTWTGRKRYIPGDTRQTKTTLAVYSSDQPDPIHTTEPGCNLIGEFDIEFPESTVHREKNDRRAVIIEMKVTTTELHMKATPIKLQRKENEDKPLKEFRKSFSLDNCQETHTDIV